MLVVVIRGVCFTFSPQEAKLGSKGVNKPYCCASFNFPGIFAKRVCPNYRLPDYCISPHSEEESDSARYYHVNKNRTQPPSRGIMYLLGELPRATLPRRSHSKSFSSNWFGQSRFKRNSFIKQWPSKPHYLSTRVVIRALERWWSSSVHQLASRITLTWSNPTEMISRRTAKVQWPRRFRHTTMALAPCFVSWQVSRRKSMPVITTEKKKKLWHAPN